MSTPPAPTPPITSGPSATPTPRGWWRRNRWALLALPLALALTVVAAGDRVRTLWWQQDLRSPTTAGDDGTVDFRQQTGDDGALEVQVRLDGIGDATTLPDRLELPPGTRAVQVELTLSADPDVPLVHCRLAVRDTDGTRYDYRSSGWGANQPASPCVPADTTGPWPSAGGVSDGAGADALPRPTTWSVSPVVVVPEGVDLTDVVLWWQMPEHVLLEVPR